ncbi:hypothetical protein VSR01_17410 [Actinacidiphila sp. DG2A-62]|uniref:hypothetical protein n=1 Tax=Actinacidiphila sp. DG2A-62 TaxID=3108821 RepID=UPI002DBC4A96|nr:hypothetical protein [Actinacidiphila sp. DG2A-62]MEC3995217.1 hypothetical protein [Actinacidiphila sp. DG2A-62]
MTTPDDAASVQRPDRSGGHVRTGLDVGETVDCGPLPTRADTVRTRPDSECPDTPGGVRVEYRARVPRHLMGAAFAEGLAAVAAELHPPEPEPEPAPPPAGRRAEVAEAIRSAFDLPADLLRKDPRP